MKWVGTQWNTGVGFRERSLIFDRGCEELTGRWGKRVMEERVQIRAHGGVEGDQMGLRGSHVFGPSVKQTVR